MIITPQSQGDSYVLKLQGRLDANWADLVGKAIETAIRAGHHEVDLDFGEVSYISSAGLRILLKYYKQLKAARGALRVVRPTEPVLNVIRLSGLMEILLNPTRQPPTTVPTSQATPDAGQEEPRRWQREGIDFESYKLSSAGALEGHVLGRPEAFSKGQLSAADSRQVHCTEDILAVGLGAFGHRPEDTEGRLGESLVVAGVAVTLPTDGSSVPDYQVTERELVPDLNLAYGLVARGTFSRLIRFEARRGQRGVLSLGDLVESVLQELQSESAGFAILAESASVVGAMLKRSPALARG